MIIKRELKGEYYFNFFIRQIQRFEAATNSRETTWVGISRGAERSIEAAVATSPWKDSNI